MIKKLFVILFCIIVFSCHSPINITGEWENDDRILKFNDYGNFTIEFKNPNEIKSFHGTTIVKKNFIILLFEEYKTIDNNFHTVDNTNLAGHKEAMEITIDNNIMYTKILTTKKVYQYTKK